MKKTSYILGLIFLSFFVSCNDDDGYESQSVNDFIWKGLNSWYYWKSDVPALQSSYFSNDQDYNSFINGTNPTIFFNNLLYDPLNVDRFSWIVEDLDALLKGFSGIGVSSGMDFSLAYLDQNNQTMIGMVNYVVPNSPASQEGVQRGDIFYQVNGAAITRENYRNLLSSNFSVTFAVQATMTDDGLELEGARNVGINSVELEENPIHFTTIINQESHKVGYLVYNGFKANYNDELNEVFAQFKSQGVTDLILDLRYNGGGSLTTSVALAQMITGQFTGSEYVSVEYNQAHNNRNKTYNLDTEMGVYEFQNGTNQLVGTEQINSLNLNKVYVLTSYSTASASELTISGLNPYVDVVKIGGQTYGKFVGSITLFDSGNDFLNYNGRNLSHNYAMQPIVFAYFNAQDEVYTSGIQPNYEVSFSDYIGTLGAFGNANTDLALQKALDVITGSSTRRTSNFSTPLQEVGTTKTLSKFKTELYIE